MSQPADWNIPLVGPASPTEMASRISGSLDALLSHHAGAERPDYAVAGTVWADTSVAGKITYKLFDGATDQVLYIVDTVTGGITSPNWIASAIQLGNQVTMSTPAVTFTGIPAAAKRVNIHLNGMSGSGTSNIALRLGPATGLESTGYAGNISGIGTDSVGTQSAGGTALTLLYSIAAAEAYSGKVVLEKVSGNLWSIVSHLRSTVTTQYLMNGSKSLAGPLERVSIFSANGSDVFDAGTANISWEV